MLALVLLAPVAAAATGAAEAISAWSELARITGVQAAGLGMYTVALAARHRSVTATMGIDGALGLHRAAGTATVALVLTHLLVVLMDDPTNVALLHPLDAPARAAAGVGACVTLALLVVLAAARRRIPAAYEVWRWGHLVLAATAGLLAVLHVVWVDRLIHSPLWATWMALLLLGAVTAVTARWAWRPARAGRFVVCDVRALDGDVSTVALAPLDGRLDFRAGQFAWLRLRRWRTDTDHPFTLSSSPDDDRVTLDIRHRGDWTTGPLRDVRPGHTVWLDGPHGAMTLDRADGLAGIVMVAAGVGVAPMMSMLRTMAHRGDRRPVWLVVPPVHLHAGELRRLAAVLDLTICPVLRRPFTADVLGGCLPGPEHARRLAAYLCGPPAMVDDAAAALAPLGVPARLTFAERFDH